MDELSYFASVGFKTNFIIQQQKVRRILIIATLAVNEFRNTRCAKIIPHFLFTANQELSTPTIYKYPIRSLVGNAAHQQIFVTKSTMQHVMCHYYIWYLEAMTA